MICKILSKRIQKLDMGEKYKEKFQQVLIMISKKYKNELLNKSLIIKKVCVKYLKICNEFILSQPVQSSLCALQFIKSIQMDIYEGKSYELYIIKIKMHLLYVKCFDLKLDQIKNKHFLVTLKKKNLHQEQNQWQEKKYRYLQRLKIFCDEIKQCYFSPLLIKDYYSNIQLLYFLCLRHEIQKAKCQIIHIDEVLSFDSIFQDIKKYLLLLFQSLKSHLLELNQRLSYSQKKVFQLLTIKVNYMVQVFCIESILKFLSLLQEEISKKETTQSNQIRIQTLKNKFLSQQLDILWAKYENIFNKVPNNVGKEETYKIVSEILNSWSDQNLKNQHQNHNQSNLFTQRLGISQVYKSDDTSSNKFELQNSALEFRKLNKIQTKYQSQKNQQLSDFMNFIKEDQFQKQQIQSLTDEFHQKERKSSLQLINKKKILRFKTDVSQNLNQNLKIKIQDQQFQTDKKKFSHLKSQRKSSEYKPIQFVRNSLIDSSKRSNFGIFKDMKNVFEYIHQKNQQKKNSQNNQSRNRANSLINYSEPLQKGPVKNLALILTSQGLKKLNFLKAPSMNFLQKIKNTQNQRLRRIKSMDIFQQIKKPFEKQVKMSDQKKKNQRSQSLYFPFIEEPKSSNKSTFSQCLEKPKNQLGTKNRVTFFKCEESNLKLQANNLNNELKQRQKLKLHTRSKSKKTTLDMMSLQKFKYLRGKYENIDENNQNSENKFSYEQRVNQEGGQQLTEQNLNI